MLEARLQTSYQGAQNGVAPYLGNAGAALQSGEAGVFHLLAGSPIDRREPPVHL